MNKIVLGTWSISGDYGYKNEKDSIKLIDFSFKNGIREYDTAPNYGYGYAENLLGNILKNKKKVLLNTKVGNNHKKYKSFNLKKIEKSFLKSLKNLKKINILFLHNPREDINYKLVIPFLNELKNSKLIKNYGLSLARDYKYDKKILGYFKTFQIDYNLFNFNINSEIKKKNNYGRSPLASGLLSKNIFVKKLNKNDHRKIWLNQNRIFWINKKKKFINKNIIGNIKKNSIQFVKHSKDLKKIIIGARTQEQLKSLINLFKQNNYTNFEYLKKKLNEYDKKIQKKSY